MLILIPVMIHIFQPLYFAICFSWQEFVFIYMNKAKGVLNFGFQKEGMNLLLPSGGLVTKSCLTLESMDCSMPGSSDHGILQARILEWVAITFSKRESHSVLSNSVTPYNPWSSPGQNTGLGSFFPSPADLPNPGIKPGSPALQADSLATELSGKPHIVL